MARKILLADDSVTAQNMGRKILTDAGYEVVTVNNGSAALKRITEQRPDLIVLDVYMPGYSGLEVCQRIKENRETTRIPILLTVGKLEPFKPEEARRARADAFVVKPFEASELLSALTKLEDKIVPQPEPYKPGRFAKAIAVVDSESERFVESDDSWKARLRMPVNGPKEHEPEAEVDYAASQGKGFRDFLAEDTRGKRKAKARPVDPPAERPVLAGLLQDITPEEIAAITAAAARLNGTVPRAASAEAPITIVPAGQTHKQEVPAEEAAPVTFAGAPEFQPAASAPENVAETLPTREPKIEVALPEPVQAAPAAPELAAPFAPGPQASATECVAEPVSPQGEEMKAQPGLVTSHLHAVAHAATEPQETAAEEETETQHAPAPTSAPEPVMGPQSVAPEPDDDVMAALQSLMPASNAGASSAQPARENSAYAKPDASVGVAAVVAAAALSGVGAHSLGPHWIAEEVSLAAGEATHPLEKEMQEAYAAFAAKESEAVVSVSPLPTIPGPSSEATVAIPLAQVAASPTLHAMASAAAASKGGTATSVTAVVVQKTPVATELATPSVMEDVAPPLEAEIASLPPASPNTVELPLASASAIVTDKPGGTEEMVAQWKNIRDSIAGAAAKPVTAKEPVYEVGPTPPVTEPAVVATAEVAPAAAGATDPTAIASIVDSVLAELRPKIVQEIARKLADPKKG